MKVEAYRSTPLERCTLHHWLMTARGRGWTLEQYVESSERYNFRCSLPSEGEIGRILAAEGASV